MELPGLREARERKDLSQRRLGEIAGVSYPRISALENGGEARQSTAEKLAKALGVDVKALRTNEDRRMRGQVELLEFRLRQYERREEQSDEKWLNLHGIAALMEKRTPNERLRERLSFVAGVSIERWAGLFDWEEEEQALLKETA